VVVISGGLARGTKAGENEWEIAMPPTIPKKNLTSQSTKPVYDRWAMSG